MLTPPKPSFINVGTSDGVAGVPRSALDDAYSEQGVKLHRTLHGSGERDNPPTGPDVRPDGRAPSRSLTQVVLEDAAFGPLSRMIEADRAQAIADLERDNEFAPNDVNRGPYVLHLSVRDRRLVFDIRDQSAQPVVAHVLALGPFRRLIKDYHLLLDSYEKAVEEGHEAKLEAIDMGRRGLHNEAANLMRERLAGKVTMNLPTARRLFTLIAILCQRL